MKTHLVKTRLVNSYVVEYPDKLMVIDVAVRCHNFVLGFIETHLNRDIRDIHLVTCTHDDPDHMGGIQALATLSKAPIALPEAAGNTLSKFINDPTGHVSRFTTSVAELTRPRMWKMYANPKRTRKAQQQPQYSGNPEHEPQTSLTKKKIKPNFRFDHDGRLPGFEDWQVIHTPGHSWDSCCFYHQASGSLITGDTLLGSNTKNTLVLPSIYSNRKHTMQSLEKLRALDVQAVYPGHGRTFQGENLIP